MHWIDSSSLHGREPETPYRYPAWWHITLALVLALVLQASILSRLRWGAVPPSAVLLVVVWYSVRLGPQRAAFLGLIAGLCEDLLSGTTGGSWMLATLAAAVLTAILSQRFFSNSPLLYAALAFVATFVRNAVFWTVMQATGSPFAWSTLHFHDAIRQAILDSLVLGLFAWWYRARHRDSA